MIDLRLLTIVRNAVSCAARHGRFYKLGQFLLMAGLEEASRLAYGVSSLKNSVVVCNECDLPVNQNSS